MRPALLLATESDPGCVALARGWTDLRPEDCGLLWERFVLDRLVSDPTEPEFRYWRDKDQHEIEFVLPAGRNLVVATSVPKPYTRELGGLTITSLDDLALCRCFAFIGFGLSGMF